MQTHLTDITVRAMKAQARQVTYWDISLPAFGLRVSQRGTKSWVFMTGRDRKLTTFARYPELSLKEARTEARKLLTDTKPKTGPVTFGEAKTLFLAQKEQTKKPRTVADYTRLLTRHFATFEDIPLTDLTTSNVMEAIDALADTPSEQAHAFVAVKTLLRFCVGRGFLTHSPLAALQTPARAVARDRVLGDTELKNIVLAAFHEPSAFGRIVLLCVFTGLRRTEAGGMRWEWIDQKDRIIALPPEVTKNNRGHVFPYGQAVVDLLAALTTTEGYLFPGRDSAQQFFNGWSRAKRAFDKKCHVDGWTLHDLRRTFATNLAALGTPVHVTERLLAHTSGTVSGVAAIYNRHSYIPEMRAAIALWENKLKSLVR